MQSLNAAFRRVAPGIIAAIACLCFITPSHAADGDYLWAKQLGGTLYDGALSIAVDASGNIYTAGFFRGTVDFDPGAGTLNFTSAGGSDIAICKFDSTGALVWAKQMGSTGDEAAYAIALDSYENVYTTGTFQGTVDFDPSAGTANLTSVFGDDVFISKLDSDGNFVWAKQLGGGSDGSSRGIALDSDGNVYVTGYFTGTVDYDPGAGTANLTSAGSNDVFVSKLDSAGTYVWGKQIGGTSNDTALSIAVDSNGNVYTTGDFQGACDFDPDAGTASLSSAGNRDIFVSKLDETGAYVWASRVGSSTNDVGVSVTLSNSGAPYVAGYFTGTVDFDPGASTSDLTSAGSNDIFVLSLDSAGTFNWVKQLGGTDLDISSSVALDTNGNIYITGRFQGTSDFDPGAGTANLTAVAGGDMFISKLDNTGAFVWAKLIGGSNYQYGFAIAVDASENVYATGVFEGTTDFDPGVGTANLTESGGGDMFVLKLSGSDSTAPTVAMSSATANPTNGLPIAVTATFSEPVTGFTIADITPSNGTVGNFAGGPTAYTFDLTPSGQGSVTANIAGSVCTDITGNTNTAAPQFSRVYDSVEPGVVLSSTEPNPTNASPIAVTVTFNESVSGFTAGDISAGNGAVSNFSGSGDTYTFDLTPSGQGAVTADVAAGVAQDSASNDNTAATQFTRSFDSVAPNAVISSTAPDPTNTSPIPVSIVFSEPVTNFDTLSITLGNGTVNNFAGSGDTYSFDLVPSDNGTVTVDIGASVCTDSAGNPNTTATQLLRDYDNVDPTVSITTTETDPTNATSIPMTITFSKNVTGFVTGDITLTNATKNSFTPVTQKIYTFNLVPTGQGIVSVDVAAGVCLSTASNPNQAGSFSTTFDSVGPAVVLATTAANPTRFTPIPVTVTFDEAVADFDSGDVAPTNATVVNFAGSGANYTFDLAPISAGAVSANVAAASAHDTATNASSASNLLARTYDNVPPIITLLGSDPVQVDQFMPYTDAGASASDNLDGNITSNIIEDTSDVDTNVIGPYIVTYDVTDTAGNNAMQVTRTVEVVAASTGLPLNPWIISAVLLIAGLAKMRLRKRGVSQ